MAALVQGEDNIEFGDAAAAAAAYLLSGSDDNRRAVEFLGEPAGYQPGDSNRIVLIAGNQQGRNSLSQYLLSGLV